MAGVLIPEARHFILPDGITSTEGPSLNGICDEVNVPLADWQKALTVAAGAKTPDGVYAAETVVVSIPRQAGKTHWARAYVFAQCIKHAGTTVAWTAHHTKVAAESFASLKTLAMTPEVSPHIDRIVGGRGSEAIEFANGSRIIMAAREKGGIRGFAKVRIIVLDEAQILTEAAMSDMVPTMNQAWNPQIVMLGTPPRPKDPGEVFSSRRADALEAVERGEHPEGLLYVEFSADGDAETDDRKQWRTANPSYPKFTPVAAFRRMRRELSEDNFRREALGIWDDKSAPDVITPETWAERMDSGSLALERLALAIDVAPELASASIAMAGMRADGRWHVEVLDSRRGADWVPARVAAWVALNPKVRAVVLDVGTAAKAIADDFEPLKIRLTLPRVADVGSACARLVEAVRLDQLRHNGQTNLTYSLSQARKRDLGRTGLWAWTPRDPGSDITPVAAVTLALWGAQKSDVTRPRGRSGSGKVVVL